MRSYLRRTMILATCLTAGLVWSGCEAKKATEYVAGVSTQVSVPRDLKAVRIDIRVGGVPQFCNAYRVYDGKVQLPRSLGAFATTDNAVTAGPVMFSIVGYTDDDLANAAFADCLTTEIGKDKARVLRRSRQPYIPDEIRFIPMPLKYSCFDVPCGDEETCKGGKCVSATLNEEQARAQFPNFNPDLVDGSNANCFSAKQCMTFAPPAVVVNPDDCTYAVAISPSSPPPISPLVDPFRQPCATNADCKNLSTCTILDPGAALPALPGRCDALPPGTPWEGTNVEVVYDGGMNREILDLDPEEGFFFSDPAKPQQFRLAPGLCDMVKGTNGAKHRITAVRAGGTCQPKQFAQPICADDQLAQMGVDPGGVASNGDPPDDCSTVQLKPPRGALMVVVDNTEGHAAFFNAEELGAIDLPLRDPAFAETDIGLQYTPGAAACSPTQPPVIPLEAASSVRQKLVDNFTTFATTPSNLVPGAPNFEGALESAYATLGALPNTTYYRRAVVVIGNRDFAADQCPAITGTAVDAAQRERTTPADVTKPINTYVIQLTKAPGTELNSPLEPGVYQLGAAGSATPPNPDARGTKKNAKDAFQQVINTLATCVYDVDDNASAPKDNDTISFSDPVENKTEKVAPNATCQGENAPGAGWGYAPSPVAGKKRIFFCSDTCATYRGVLAKASDFALLYQKPPIAVPVFAHKAACEPK